MRSSGHAALPPCRDAGAHRDRTRVHHGRRLAHGEALESWLDWLTEHDVPHSGITGTEFGEHLNLHAPDNIAIELFVIKPEVAAAMGVGDQNSS
jgi:hypothetical protein